MGERVTPFSKACENLRLDGRQELALTMSSVYTQEALKQMKTQAVKDIWHAMIGKPAGIRNTTGLKTGDEIIQAILEGQREPEFLTKFTVRAPKQSVGVELKEEMPPKPGKTESEKKKPGPKPKPVVVPTAPPLRPKLLQAYESTELPIRALTIHRISVKKLFVGDTMYFLDSQTNKLYQSMDGRPGSSCGLWNPETREVQEEVS